jgi:hypothetical protein
LHRRGQHQAAGQLSARARRRTRGTWTCGRGAGPGRRRSCTARSRWSQPGSSHVRGGSRTGPPGRRGRRTGPGAGPRAWSGALSPAGAAAGAASRTTPRVSPVAAAQAPGCPWPDLPVPLHLRRRDHHRLAEHGRAARADLLHAPDDQRGPVPPPRSLPLFSGDAASSSGAGFGTPTPAALGHGGRSSPASQTLPMPCSIR